MGSEGEGEDESHISFRCSKELDEQFMIAYRKAAVEEWAPAEGSRSDGLRQLMRAFVNDPEIIRKGSPDEKMEE